MVQLPPSGGNLEELGKLADASYVISPEASFKLVDYEWIEIRANGVTSRIAMESYRLVTEFKVPRTPSDVYASIDTDVPFDEFLELLSRYVSARILVPAVAEQARERCPSELFKDELLENTTLQDKVASALGRGSFCVIPNAFKAEVAER